MRTTITVGLLLDEANGRREFTQPTLGGCEP